MNWLIQQFFSAASKIFIVVKRRFLSNEKLVSEQFIAVQTCQLSRQRY